MDLSPRGIVLLSIAIVVFSALIPTALESLFGVDTGNWSAGAVALWVAIPVVILAGALLLFVPGSKGGDGG